MILPSLISVSVAPTSYFFWSAALTLVDTSIARAVESSPNRMRMAGISVSLWVDVSVVGAGALHGSWPALNTFRYGPATKSPPRRQRGGRHLEMGRAAWRGR